MMIEAVEPAFPPVSPPTRSVELLAMCRAQFDVTPPNGCAQPERVAAFLADVDVSAFWVLAHHFLLSLRRRADMRNFTLQPLPKPLDLPYTSLRPTQANTARFPLTSAAST
jgi:hypothetical protein